MQIKCVINLNHTKRTQAALGMHMYTHTHSPPLFSTRQDTQSPLALMSFAGYVPHVSVCHRQEITVNEPGASESYSTALESAILYLSD